MIPVNVVVVEVFWYNKSIFFNNYIFFYSFVVSLHVFVVVFYGVPNHEELLDTGGQDCGQDISVEC